MLFKTFVQPSQRPPPSHKFFADMTETPPPYDILQGRIQWFDGMVERPIAMGETLSVIAERIYSIRDFGAMGVGVASTTASPWTENRRLLCTRSVSRVQNGH